MTRGVIYATLLESSILLLENIYSTVITYDNCHLRWSYFYSTGHCTLVCQRFALHSELLVGMPYGVNLLDNFILPIESVT
jgi:hypothetical protein